MRVQHTISLPVPLAVKLRELAVMRGIKLNTWIVEQLQKAVDTAEEEKKTEK